jgi:hypothetical protein
MKELPEPLVPNDFYKLFLDLQKERCHDATARLVYTILPIAQLVEMTLSHDVGFLSSLVHSGICASSSSKCRQRTGTPTSLSQSPMI